MTLAEIKKLLSESLIKEASVELREDNGDSVDLQIDKFLMDYESQATAALKNESVNFFEMTKNFLLEKEEKEPAVKTSKEIDLKSFGADVARLVDNASSLLELRSAILRRAINYLVENYDDETVRRFKVLMEDEFDMAPGESEVVDEPEPVPTAGEAGPYGSAGSV
jgi:hypothetical protein